MCMCERDSGSIIYTLDYNVYIRQQKQEQQKQKSTRANKNFYIKFPG